MLRAGECVPEKGSERVEGVRRDAGDSVRNSQSEGDVTHPPALPSHPLTLPRGGNTSVCVSDSPSEERGRCFVWGLGPPGHPLPELKGREREKRRRNVCVCGGGHLQQLQLHSSKV